MLTRAYAQGITPPAGEHERADSAAPLISVVTVVFNAIGALRVTTDSVREQDADGVEHVVVDGGSTDGTVEFLKTGNAGSIRWISEPDAGIYDAMNKGLRLARGRYIHFLNAGDTFIHRGTLREVSELLADSPAILMNRVQAVGGSGAVERLLPTTFGLTRPRETFMSAYCHQAAFVRRDAYEAVGGFDLGYSHFADFKALWTIRSSENVVLETPLEVARFPLDGVSSDWRHSAELAKERERLLAELGEPSSPVGYRLRILKAHLYKFRMMIRHLLR